MTAERSGAKLRPKRKRGENYDGATSLSDQQQSDIVAGNPRDVICGQGLHNLCHQGNLQFHLLTNKYRDSYRKARRQEKSRIIRMIISEIKRTGARFLKRVEDAGVLKLVEVDYKATYEKVGHALRDRRMNETKNAENLAARNDKSESASLSHPWQQAQQLPQSSAAIVGSTGFQTKSRLPTTSCLSQHRDKVSQGVKAFQGPHTEIDVTRRAILAKLLHQANSAVGGSRGFQQLPGSGVAPTPFPRPQLLPLLHGLHQIQTLQGMGPAGIELLLKNQLQRDKLPLISSSLLHPPPAHLFSAAATLRPQGLYRGDTPGFEYRQLGFQSTAYASPPSQISGCDVEAAALNEDG
eukprot:scaffold9345_cov120-Cylindrotheca_fusiformis.AAC.13